MTTNLDMPHKQFRTKQVRGRVEKDDDELIMVVLDGYKPMSLAKARKMNIKFKKDGSR